MKLKNRSNLFLVVRHTKGEVDEIPIAAFLTLESAEEYAGSCQQQFEELRVEHYVFTVVPVIYYDQ